MHEWTGHIGGWAGHGWLVMAGGHEQACVKVVNQQWGEGGHGLYD